MRNLNPFEIKPSLKGKAAKSPLEWEESALDEGSRVEGFAEASVGKRRQIFLWVILFCGFAVIFGRLFYLQILHGNEYRGFSEENRTRSQVVFAPRGLIKDRAGVVLAQNIASFALAAIPADLPKQGLEELVNKLSANFELKPEEVLEKLKAADRSSLNPVILKQDLSKEKAILFESRASEFLGFSLQKVPIREYPDAEVFSHILGFAGLISPSDFNDINKKEYELNDFIGKIGLELEYEKYLHGQNGQNQVETDAAGKVIRPLGEVLPKSGNTLVLNIDSELQKVIYDNLKNGSVSRKAAVVALNPKNGEVLALLSLPGYDNNLFAHGIKQEDYNRLLNDKNLPLFNRAISGTYPPGSTVKPMVAAAALEEKIVSPQTVIYDNGVLVIPNQYDPKIAYNFYGWKRDGLGPMTVKTAIAQSSDIFFYTVAGGNYKSKIQGLGADKLAGYYRKFNLGKITGIDLQGEKPGLVPDPAWKAQNFKDDPILSKWYLGDTYHIGIGQGDVLATPLQVAIWTAVFANSGVAYKPRILDKVIDTEGNVVYENKPEILISKFLDAQNIKIVQEGMRETVVSGSGRQLLDLPITSAGKTGTSQFDGSDPKRTHAWFTVYAPYEDPQIVITILVEAGGEGHAVAAPVAKAALKWWAENRYNKN